MPLMIVACVIVAAVAGYALTRHKGGSGDGATRADRSASDHRAPTGSSGGGPSGGGSGGGGGSGFAGHVTYSGTAHIEADLYDFCDLASRDAVYVKSVAYDYHAQVFINPPLANGGEKETNPFNLAIVVDAMNPEGVQLTSAYVVDSPRLLVQFWELEVSGNSVHGKLTGSNLGTGPMLDAYNSVNEPPAASFCGGTLNPVGPEPAKLDVGATLDGTIDGDQVDLTFKGDTFSTMTRMQMRIKASA